MDSILSYAEADRVGDLHDHMSRDSGDLNPFFALIVTLASYLVLLPQITYVHETGHFLVASALGIRVYVTPASIVAVGSVSPLQFALIGLAGGLFQALIPALLFLVICLTVRGTSPSAWEKPKLALTAVTIFEVVLFTHVLVGIGWALVEGLLNPLYQIIDGTLLLIALIIISYVVAFRFVQERWRQILKRQTSQSTV